jgi:hypothetical protein
MAKTQPRTLDVFECVVFCYCSFQLRNAAVVRSSSLRLLWESANLARRQMTGCRPQNVRPDFSRGLASQIRLQTRQSHEIYCIYNTTMLIN